jgi:hypothetical protein
MQVAFLRKLFLAEQITRLAAIAALLIAVTGGIMGLPPKVMKNAFYPATALHGSVALPFVIPSEAEGSAVLRTIPGNAFFDRVYPCSPQRTRAENDVFECFSSIPELFSQE